MADYRLTNKAVEDLNEIWDYTFRNWSEEQADIYYSQLLDTCQDIANQPDLGKHYEGIKLELRGYNVSRHIIFYRIIKTNLIEVARILHGQMDLETRMTE